MSKVEIIQHNLDSDWQSAVEWALTESSQFPWQFQPQKTLRSEREPWNSQFTHMFFSEGSVVTPFWDMVMPIIETLDPLSLIKVKANLTIATASRHNHEWHTDSDDPRLSAAIYYANTNNGSTEFLSGDMIDSQKGQLVVFPANMEHRVWTHTDVQARAVISFVYLAKQST